MTDLTLEQAMASLGVSRRWLLHLIEAGRLEVHAGAGEVRVNAASIARYKAAAMLKPKRADQDRLALRARMRRGDA